MKLLSIAAILLLLVACKDKKSASTEPTKETTVSTTLPTEPAKEEPGTTVSTGSSIVGTWRLTDMLGKGIDEERKNQMLGKVTMEFTSSGSYIATSPNDKETGTYTYDETTGKLVTSNNDKKAEPDAVTVEFKGDEMIVTQEEGSMIFKRDK